MAQCQPKKERVSTIPAPETQFQTPGLTYSTYTPVKTELSPPIQLPETGALWANVGKTAMNAVAQAGEMLQKSPLNPAVKEAMNYGIANYKQGEASLKALGPYAALLTQHGPQGPSTMAPGAVTDPTMATALLQALGLVPKPKEGTTGPPPAVNDGGAAAAAEAAAKEAAAKAGGQNQGFEATEYPSGQPQPKTTTPATPAKKAPPPTEGMRPKNVAQVGLVPSQGGSTAALTAGGDGVLNTGQPQSSDIEAVPAAQYRAQQQPSSIWSPLRPAPLAPPAPAAPPQPAAQPAAQPPDQPPAEPSTPGTVPGSLSDQYAQAQEQKRQADLSNWQEQSARQTLPMTASGAMAWMKDRTSLVTGVTMLDHGGPNGEPAAAFHMKSPDGKPGGTNIVPVSQMVQSGAGPTVAAQNTSLMLSQSDKLRQQQQNAMVAPPGPPPAAPSAGALAAAQQQAAQYAATGGPSPAGQPPVTPSAGALGAAQQQAAQYAATGGPPPAAPGVQGARQPLTDIYGNPISAYTNVASAGGLTPDQLTAQTAPAGQPAQPHTQPREPLPPAAVWDTVPQADQDSIKAKADATAKPAGEYTGDRRVEGVAGPYTYYINDNPHDTWRGRIYTTLPGPAGGYYNQQRWYLGTREYQTFELPESQMRQKMKDYWSTSAGQLTPQYIDTMSKEEMLPWLQRAWYNDHYASVSPTGDYPNDLDAAEVYHKNIAKISDILQTLAAHGFSRLSSADLLRAKGGNAATSIGMPWLGSAGMDEKTSEAIRDLDETVNQTQQYVHDHPRLLLTPGKAEGLNFPDVKLIPATDVPLPSIPSSDAFSDIAFGGMDIKNKLLRLNALQAGGDDRYKDLRDQGDTQWIRVAPKHDANIARITNGEPIPDKGNLYQDHSFPGDPPVIPVAKYKKWAAQHPNTQFTTEKGNVRTSAP